MKMTASYLIVNEPVHGAGNTIRSVLENICTVTLSKLDSGGFAVNYRFNHCFKKRHPMSYSNEYTEEEVLDDFYRTKVLNMARANGTIYLKR